MTSGTWKWDFASGLIILLPILVSIYVIAYLYGILASTPLSNVLTEKTLSSVPFLAQYADSPTFVTFVHVITTLALFVVMVFSFGYLMRTTLGDLFERALDDLMNQVPGLRVVYNASKMAVETALSGTDDLQRPVKLEPWDGMRMTAFKTGKSTGDGRDILFLPTSPNITSGYVLEVEPEDYQETDERVEDALTRILSAGFGDTDDHAMPIELTTDGSDADD